MNSNYFWEMQCRVFRIKDACAHLASLFCERRNITPLQLRVLLALGRKSPQTAGELAKHSGMAATNLSAAIRHLQCEGLVTRSRCNGDERCVHIGLSEKGARLVQHFIRLIEELPESNLKSDKAHLDYLDCFAQNLEQGASQMATTTKETPDEH